MKWSELYVDIKLDNFYMFISMCNNPYGECLCQDKKQERKWGIYFCVCYAINSFSRFINKFDNNINRAECCLSQETT